jgi:Holliday junction resolvase-like predicted endonuclease
MIPPKSIKNREDSDKRKEIGYLGEEKAIKILEVLGFTELNRSPYKNQIYDLEALNPKGCPSIIEVRTRSAKAETQFFTIRDTKIRNLEIASQNMHVSAYFMLINKFGFKLISLDQLKSKLPPDVRIFKFRKSTSGIIISGTEKRTDKIEFRADHETRKAFDMIFAELAPKLMSRLNRRVYKDDVVRLLMNVYKKQPWLVDELIAAKASFK